MTVVNNAGEVLYGFRVYHSGNACSSCIRQKYYGFVVECYPRMSVACGRLPHAALFFVLDLEEAIPNWTEESAVERPCLMNISTEHITVPTRYLKRYLNKILD